MVDIETLLEIIINAFQAIFYKTKTLHLMIINKLIWLNKNLFPMDKLTGIPYMREILLQEIQIIQYKR